MAAKKQKTRHIAMAAIINAKLMPGEQVKNCWTKINQKKGTNAFVDNFFQQLFLQHPETRKLFPEDLALQKINLLTTLDNVINGIDYIDCINSELESLGKHHKNLGISSEMFDAFNIVALSAANYASDFTLSDTELNAWQKAFKKISDIMLKAY